MKCCYCGATAIHEQEDEPTGWLDTEEEFTSLHHYRCLISSEHHFYTESCKPGE